MNCYNGEKYLGEALDSVLTQTYQNWELIFWDNQSTDKSAKFFQSYGDQRLKYFYAPKHTLLYKARNYAIEKASGEFYAFLDVDDWWNPEKLEKQIPLFADPEIGLVYGNYRLENEINSTSRILIRKKLPTGYILNSLLKKYIVGMLTIVIRKDAFDSLKYGFNPQYQFIGDFDCVIRIASDWKISCIQKPIAHYRWHGNNESIKKKGKLIRELSLWVYEKEKNHSIAAQKGFTHLATVILYLRGVRFFENKMRSCTWKIFCVMPLSVEKIKILLILLLPRKIVSFLKA